VVADYSDLQKTNYDSIIKLIKAYIKEGVIVLYENGNEIDDRLIDFFNNNKIIIKSEKEFFNDILEEK
jgi:hypothetical protein